MNAFTGGCHYDENCGKFRLRCGGCPQLDSSEPQDLSRQIWLRKHEAFSFPVAQQLQLVTPSRWLAEEAKKSALFSKRVVSVIPNGINIENFQPRDRRLAREIHGIPSKAKTILFVADSAGEKRKGLKILVEALKELENPEQYFFAIIGAGYLVRSLGPIQGTWIL